MLTNEDIDELVELSEEEIKAVEELFNTLQEDKTYDITELKKHVEEADVTVPSHHLEYVPL